MKPPINSIVQAVRNRFAARSCARRANALYRQRRFAEAVPLYQEALALRPRQPVVHYSLGLALYKSGKKQEGRAEWKTVLAITEHGNKYLYEQATILLRQFA